MREQLHMKYRHQCSETLHVWFRIQSTGSRTATLFMGLLYIPWDVLMVTTRTRLSFPGCLYYVTEKPLGRDRSTFLQYNYISNGYIPHWVTPLVVFVHAWEVLFARSDKSNTDRGASDVGKRQICRRTEDQEEWSVVCQLKNDQVLALQYHHVGCVHKS